MLFVFNTTIQFKESKNAFTKIINRNNQAPRKKHEN